MRNIMVICWLSSYWSNVWVMMIIIHMFVIWLHSKYEISFLNIRLRCSESSAVSIKGCVIALMPSVSIKHIKIILPVKIKTTSFMVISVSFNIVE